MKGSEDEYNGADVLRRSDRIWARGGGTASEALKVDPALHAVPASPARTGYQRRRVLVSAYAFSPVMGSEPGVGWNICSRLAAIHDVTVLTRSWNEKLWPEDEEHR